LEALKNNTVGYAIAALGAVVALAGGLADTLGIGADGADGLGGKQLAALLIGLVILAAGLAVVFLSGQEEESEETGAATPMPMPMPARRWPRRPTPTETVVRRLVLSRRTTLALAGDAAQSWERPRFVTRPRRSSIFSAEMLARQSRATSPSSSQASASAVKAASA